MLLKFLQILKIRGIYGKSTKRIVHMPINNNVKIYQNAKIISQLLEDEYNDYAFMMAIANFIKFNMHKKFKSFERNEKYKKIHILVNFVEENEISEDDLDSINICIENEVTIVLNVESILEDFSGKSSRDFLFVTFLKEFYEVSCKIENYLKGSLNRLEDQFDRDDDKIANDIQKIQKENPDKELWELYEDLDLEIESDTYAYENLNFLNNIYDSEFSEEINVTT